jgi:N-acetylglucosaminyldiphosphoundecaprenol N-acetyl-beta-D-mannosaminyltransferase
MSQPNPVSDPGPRLQVERFLDYNVCRGSMDSLVESVLATVRRPGPPVGYWLACLNPHSYVVACDDPRFRRALAAATWLIPDGAGIVMASRLLRGGIRARLSGPDAFVAISAALDKQGPFTAMFLGSSPATLDKVAQRYRQEFPNVWPVSTFSPPFRTEFDAADLTEMRAAIHAARPDVLWVGLTAPKQELLLDGFSGCPDFRFGAAIGAAFDFYAGNVKRSHPAFRRLGLEWLPRLLQEPRRLWRRMFASAPRFLWHVCLSALPPRRGRPPA